MSALSGLDAVVHVRRGTLQVAVSLRAMPGEVVALLGPNGAGKSTVLRVLSGLLPLDEGHVRLGATVFDERPPDSGSNARRDAGRVFVAPEDRGIGVVFQDYLLFAHMSVAENVAFGLRARGLGRVEARQRALTWLERVGLTALADAAPRTLSGGQAQRVALARALATEPSLLLLDEPLAALDAATRRVLRGELRRHLSTFGGVTVVVTHDPVDAYALADRVVVLDTGVVVQEGTIAEVTARPRSQYVAELVGTNLMVGVCDGTEVRGADGARLAVAGAPVGDVFAIVAPQSLSLSLPSASGSASSPRNSWSCTVVEVVRLGERARVSLHASPTGEPLPGGALTAEITAAALDELQLRPGDEVVARAKATEVSVYPA